MSHRMSDQDVARARAMARDDYTYREIGTALGFDRSTISVAVRGKPPHTHGDPVPEGCVRRPPHPGRKLTDEQVAELRAVMAGGSSVIGAARHFDVDRRTVRGIVRGEIYREPGQT